MEGYVDDCHGYNMADDSSDLVGSGAHFRTKQIFDTHVLASARPYALTSSTTLNASTHAWQVLMAPTALAPLQLTLITAWELPAWQVAKTVRLEPV